MSHFTKKPRPSFISFFIMALGRGSWFAVVSGVFLCVSARLAHTRLAVSRSADVTVVSGKGACPACQTTLQLTGVMSVAQQRRRAGGGGAQWSVEGASAAGV